MSTVICHLFILFQQFSIIVAAFQYAHLMNGYLVQLHKPLALSHALFDENRIEVFHIRQTDKFVDCGVIAYIAFHAGVSITPLLCRYAKHRHIQHIGLIGIDDACLCRCNLRRDKVLPYGIGMYAVVDFR